MSDGTWSDYFPFETGQQLKLEAKILVFTLKGTAEVVSRSDDTLSLTVEIPEQKVVGRDIPEVSLAIAMTHKADGAENGATITYRNKERVDDKVTMSSDLAKWQRRVEPSIPIASKMLGFTLRRMGDQRGEIVDVTGLNLPFEIKLKLRPA
ncbi:MAG: hypothetical protein AAFY02_01470 [Pseudomonadota bacterium]